MKWKVFSVLAGSVAVLTVAAVAAAQMGVGSSLPEEEQVHRVVSDHEEPDPFVPDDVLDDAKREDDEDGDDLEDEEESKPSAPSEPSAASESSVSEASFSEESVSEPSVSEPSADSGDSGGSD